MTAITLPGERMERLKRGRSASMRMILLHIMIIPCLAASQPDPDPTLGAPTWLWIRTYQPGSGFAPGVNLQWDARYLPYTTTLGFRYTLFTDLKSSYPGVRSRADSVEGTDFVAGLWTGAHFKNTDVAEYEIQFLYSHGSPGGISTHDSTITSVGVGMPNTLVLRRYNKYAFLMSCRTLENENPAYYKDVFKGGHALLGARSDLRVLGFQGWDTQDPRFLPGWGLHSGRIGQAFSARWVKGGETLWEAWRGALVEVQYEENRTGVDAAGVFLAGHLGGSLYYARDEKVNLLYDGAIFLDTAAARDSKNWAPRYSILTKSVFTEGIHCTKLVLGPVTYDNTSILR